MRKLLSHRRTDLGRRDDGTASALVRILECLNVFLADEVGLLQCGVEDGLSLVVNLGVVGLDIPVGRDTNGLTLSTQGDDAGVGLLVSLLANGVDKGSGKCLAHILDVGFLVEHHHVVATTGEVDTLAQAANGERDAEDDGSHAPDDERLPIGAHEVEVGVLHEVLGVGSDEGEVGPLVLLQHVLIDQTGQEHGGEERAEDTDGMKPVINEVTFESKIAEKALE